MKAFLLAAGLGTRLRPLTDHLPKCLVPINGEPLLGIWLRLLARHGYTDVLLNTHHLGGQVHAYVKARRERTPRVTLFHEPVLLGSAGTVAANEAFVAGETTFLIAYADTLMDLDLGRMQAFHAQRRSPFTIALYEAPNPTECGIAELDPEGRIVSFEEKPAQPKSRLASAGLYVAGPSLFDLLRTKTYSDFGFDVLPRLVGRMVGCNIPAYYRDTGTAARLAAAQHEWNGRHRLWE